MTELEKDDDLFLKAKKLEEELQFINLQTQFIQTEQQNLARELLRAKEELKKIQSVPLLIGSFIEMVDANYGLISTNSGSQYLVRVLSILDREKLKPNSSIALHKHSNSVVDILPSEADVNI